jgi:hypothetical protein
MLLLLLLLMLLLLLLLLLLQIPFWRCSVGVCADSSVDDVGFIDSVIQDMPRRLGTVKKGQVWENYCLLFLL